jgi:hypothetical protein
LRRGSTSYQFNIHGQLHWRTFALMSSLFFVVFCILFQLDKLCVRGSVICALFNFCVPFHFVWFGTCISSILEREGTGCLRGVLNWHRCDRAESVRWFASSGSHGMG